MAPNQEELEGATRLLPHHLTSSLDTQLDGVISAAQIEAAR
jgi:hypothetical protein